jgi:hypothetical protein
MKDVPNFRPGNGHSAQREPEPPTTRAGWVKRPNCQPLVCEITARKRTTSPEHSILAHNEIGQLEGVPVRVVQLVAVALRLDGECRFHARAEVRETVLTR